jgi:hypothetical protein
MALVRRSAVDGRVAPAAPTTAGLAVPRQPSAADIDEAAAGPPPLEEAAAAPDRPARWWTVLLGLSLAAGGAAGAYAVDRTHDIPALPAGHVGAGLVLLLLAALVLERLVEPLTRFLPGTGARNRYEQQVADLANRNPQVTLGVVAAGRARVDQRRAERAVLAWGLATGAATVAAAAAGFPLLRTLVVADPATWQVVPVWVDTLATGLVVGTLTKPLHDLLAMLAHAGARRRDPVHP